MEASGFLLICSLRIGFEDFYTKSELDVLYR